MKEDNLPLWLKYRNTKIPAYRFLDKRNFKDQEALTLKAIKPATVGKQFLNQSRSLYICLLLQDLFCIRMKGLGHFVGSMSNGSVCKIARCIRYKVTGD